MGAYVVEKYDVVIVGAGQAGIAMGFYIKRKGLSFIIVDSNKQIGDSWRNRYDSLVLFTPRKYSSLPGLQMKGPSEELPTKDEMAEYLEQYVAQFDLPVSLNTHVTSIKKKQEAFLIETNQGTMRTNQVVIASGAFQKPFIPPVTLSEVGDLFQIHSSAYRSPKQISEGSVVVVGGGNSGAQIAVELAHERNVTLAISSPFTFLPIRILGKSIFYWLDFLGLLYAGVNTKRGKWFSKQSDPIFGSELKALIAEGRIQVKPRVLKVDGNGVLFKDKSLQSFENIVWSTGFVPSYEWLELDGAVSSNGQPVQERGVSPIKGLYFLGLPWQHQRGSALICGVGRDASYLAQFISGAKNRILDRV